MTNFEQWFVVLRWFEPEEDEYLGPFRTQDGAQRVCKKLNGDIGARDADEACRAFVEPIRSGADLMSFRGEMLDQLDRAGYPMPARGR